MTEREISEFMNKLSKLMIVSFVIWMVIIAYQLILGIISLMVGYGFFTLVLMGWNIVGCIRYFKNINIIKSYRTKADAANCIAYFNAQIVPCWIFMFVNLIFGGCLGFVGNLYDLIIAYYVKSKEGELLMPVSDNYVQDVDFQQ